MMGFAELKIENLLTYWFCVVKYFFLQKVQMMLKAGLVFFEKLQKKPISLGNFPTFLPKCKKCICSQKIFISF